MCNTENVSVRERAFEDFPTELAPDGDMSVIENKDNPDFGVGGVDGQNRLVSFSDDGWIVGYSLDGAEIERTRFGKKLDAEYDTITDRVMPEEYMNGRDVSDWVWVHPRYRWLTEGCE